MKKLRLLLFKNCDKNCDGCCNKDWDLDALPDLKFEKNELSQYSKILLTGGEPMLKPDMVNSVVNQIRDLNSNCKIYMYTGLGGHVNKLYSIMELLDGATFTIHTNRDISTFFNVAFENIPVFEFKSMRVNIFKGVDISSKWFDVLKFNGWKIKSDMTWIKNCPLPENEVFKKIGDDYKY